MADHIYAIHDFDSRWARWIKDAGLSGWCVTTHALSSEPTLYFFPTIIEYGITPIARLNWGYGSSGTIPKSDQYDEFAKRCADFVKDNPYCDRFIIGNEPNWSTEWPDGRMIRPANYVDCYRRVYASIKRVRSDAKVIPAPTAPWNIESGIVWIDYWREMLNLLVGMVDELAIHTYSRGYSLSAVTSNDKMDAPYSQYYNGFRTYLDYLSVVPSEMKDLPVHITETNGNEPWPDGNTGWVQAAYEEIDLHNQKSNAQKIYSLSLFRWPRFDSRWQFETKTGVHGDFQAALGKKYRIVPVQSAEKDPVKDRVPLEDGRIWDERLTARGTKLIEADVKLGETHWKVVSGQWFNEQESQGRVNVFVEVLDENGDRLVNIPVHFYWPTGEDTKRTEAKPNDNFAVDFNMQSHGNIYGIEIADGKSDKIEGLGLGSLEQPDWNIHTSYRFVFQRGKKKKVTSLPIVAPGPDPVIIPTPGKVSEWIAVVVSDTGVNVRVGPNVSSDIIGAAPKSEEMPSGVIVPEWVPVRYKGKDGYVHSDYILLTKNVARTMDPERVPQSSSQNPYQAFLDNYGATIGALATQYSVPVGVLAAVIMAESAGKPFDEHGELIIRFENHIFWDVWGKDNQEKFNQHFKFSTGDERWKGHFWRPGNGDWNPCHVNNIQEHEVLDFAKTLDREKAYQSISMGMPQILGVGYRTAGYTSAEGMYNSFQASDKEQLEGMLRWIKTRGLIDELQRNDLYAFAVGYNGPGQASVYVSIIEKNSKEFEKII